MLMVEASNLDQAELLVKLHVRPRSTHRIQERSKELVIPVEDALRPQSSDIQGWQGF
jgi:hypothetical protein